MLSAHNRFATNLGRARDLRTLFLTRQASTAPVLDLTDILRAAVVAAVSAFDTFVHEIAKIGMLEILQNARPITPGFGRFTVTMGNVLVAVGTPRSTTWLEDEIRKQHDWLSFQHPDKVADAVRLFCGKELWKEVGKRLGIDPRSAKNRLALIVERRNKIAHEADMDSTSPGARWPIDDALVNEAINTLEQLGAAIFEVVRMP